MEMRISREEILNWMKANNSSVLGFATAHECDVQKVWDIINGK